MEMFKPGSVCDVGCGVGNFLYTFKTQGVKTVLGLEGKWVPRDRLSKYLEDSEFKYIDFEEDIAPPSQRFDLAICLEVGEHISGKNSLKLVTYLTQASDTVVFSAAIPGQGGIGHINLQWEEYWEELFAKKGFKRYDIIRSRVFDNKDLRWWYRQNIVVYSKSDLTRFFESSYRNLIVQENYINKVQEVKHYQEILDGKHGYFFYVKFLLKVTIIKVLGFAAFQRLQKKLGR
jgi:hypothetical protein